jgi:hypothetical protein
MHVRGKSYYIIDTGEVTITEPLEALLFAVPREPT